MCVAWQQNMKIFGDALRALEAPVGGVNVSGSISCGSGDYLELNFVGELPNFRVVYR